MTTSPQPESPEPLKVAGSPETIRFLCGGHVEWRVATEDGTYCMSFSRDDALNPEQEANEWLAKHLCEQPDRFMKYKVRSVVVRSQLQEEALALIDRLSDAEAAIQAARNEAEAMRADLLALQLFAGKCLSGFPDAIGSLDGLDLQDFAAQAGLLAPESTMVPCGEVCSCAEEVPTGQSTECYRVQGVLRRARIAYAAMKGDAHA